MLSTANLTSEEQDILNPLQPCERLQNSVLSGMPHRIRLDTASKQDLLALQAHFGVPRSQVIREALRFRRQELIRRGELTNE